MTQERSRRERWDSSFNTDDALIWEESFRKGQYFCWQTSFQLSYKSSFKLEYIKNTTWNKCGIHQIKQPWLFCTPDNVMMHLADASLQRSLPYRSTCTLMNSLGTRGRGDALPAELQGHCTGFYWSWQAYALYSICQHYIKHTNQHKTVHTLQLRYYFWLNFFNRRDVRALYTSILKHITS